MKKRISVFMLVFILISYSNLNAQFQAGVLAGPNIASFNADTDVDISSRFLWGAGISLEYQLNFNFAIQVQPLYLKKGGILEQKISNPKTTLDQSFLEMPLLFKYNFNHEPKIFIMAGPSFGILLSSEIDLDVSGITFNADLKNLTEALDIGLCFGSGLNIPIKPGKLIFEIKYNYGLTNLAKNGTFKAKAGHIELEESFGAEANKYKSRGIQIMVGYLIPI